MPSDASIERDGYFRIIAGGICMLMVRYFRIVLLLSVLGFGAGASAQLNPDQAERIEAASPQKSRIAAKRQRHVLIWNTPFMDNCPHKGYSVPQAEHAMKVLGKKTGAFECVVSDDVAMYLPEKLDKFDAIIFNNSNGPWIRPTAKDMVKFKGYGDNIDAVEILLRKSLLDWVKDGGGIVAYHHAIGGNTHWPEFHDMIGATYWGHPWNEEVGIKLDEPDHPLLEAFADENFRLSEEIFQYNDPWSRNNCRVLMSLDTKSTNMTVPWIHRKDNDFGLAWIRSYGKGRVFYCAIGHRTEHWWNEKILRFYLDGIQFVCGDLAADMTPSAEVEDGFISLFNGRDLSGWKGNPGLWKVTDGAITGQTTPENRISENNFLLWTGGDVEDFELRLKFRLEGGNSGIYFHSNERTDMRQEVLVGPQADFSADGRWTGVLMEYTLREILAERGQKVVIDAKGNRKVTGKTGDASELLKAVNLMEWNDYTVISRGGHTVLMINGIVMCEVQDNDPKRPTKGKLALQIHRGPEMLAQFKDIRLYRFD